MATKRSKKKAAPKKAAPKKAVTKKTVTKKSATKKTVVKKTVKRSAKKTAPDQPSLESLPVTEKIKIPCICRKSQGRWFCMKVQDGALIQCDGPFATKAECEKHFCI